MVDRSQLLKGLLDGCIIKLISRGETYGYEITSQLNQSGFTDLNEGSVYPALMRLEKKGLISSVSKKSELGPSRKYYRLTSLGELYQSEFSILWSEISDVVNQILKGGEQNE